MRENTPKQSAASHKNGEKGKGPKSPAGRTAVRFNAVKDGIFSSEIVVESAGERPQDFERLRNEIWASIQPETTLEKMLATDVIENRWRLQRVRRAERLALIARVETWIQDELRQSEELNLLKAQFLNNYEEFLRLSTPQVGAEASEMKPKIEEIRSKLAASSEGLKFLIETMEKTEKQARSAPYLSWEWDVLILACCGFGDEVARLCIKVNFANVQEAAKASKKQESEGGRDDKPNASKESKAGRTDSEDLIEKTIRLFRSAGDEPKSEKQKSGRKSSDSKPTGRDFQAELRDARSLEAWVLADTVNMAISSLKFRRTLVLAQEEAEETRRKNDAIVPPEGADRFLRAETAFERRMFRALAMLLAIQSGPAALPRLSQTP